MYKQTIIPTLLIAVMIQSPFSYGVTEKPQSQLKSEDTISGIMAENKKLQKTLKGAIFCLSKDKYITAGPPNIFGSSLKIGIPEPSGTIAIGGYTPPPKGHMYFLANELHLRTQALLARASSLPNLKEYDYVHPAVTEIKKNIDDIEARDVAIQKIIESNSYESKKGSLAMGKEMLAMREKSLDLGDTLETNKDKIYRDPAPVWKMAGHESQWK